MKPSAVHEGLASAFLDGAWTLEELAARAQVSLAGRPRWLRPLCRRVIADFAEPPAEVRVLALHLARDDELTSALRRHGRDPRIRRWFLPEPRIARVSGPPSQFDVLQVATTGALASELALRPSDLAWFADVTQRNIARASDRLRHYTYRWVRKRSGGYRLLETPKARMKVIQRWLLRAILVAVPPERSAHGFVADRSVLTYAAPHVGHRVVLRIDLEDFFASITVARVRAVFARVGYPHAVASALAGICCAATPEPVLRSNPEPQAAERYRVAQRLRIPHLPQGSPTSPALSNLIVFRLDRRLAGLARATGIQYSRYADDLAFSGGEAFERGLPRFVARVGAIAGEEGFCVRYRKLRIMRASGRQRLAGLVVNERLNVPRRDYDVLRATLHNALRHGPDAQNRGGHADFRAHVEGRIAWVAQSNPKRGARLRALFDRIAWPDRQA